MATLQDLRAEYPQYNDLSDAQFADGIHRKFYSDMPRAEFDRRLARPPLGRPKQTLAPEGGHRGSILPYRLDPEGNPIWDFANEGLPGAIVDALSLPGDVVTGKTDVHSPEAMERTTGLAMLATGRPAGAKPRTVTGRAIPNMRTIPGTPTAEELRAAGSAGFEQARGMGVDYSSTSVKTMADDLQRTLESEGFRDVITPKTFGIIRDLQSPPEGSIATISDLVALRKTLQKVAGNVADREESKAATKAIKALDKFLGQPDPASVVAGPAAAAGGVLDDARGNYAAAMRSDRITGAQERAEANAAVANSGLNSGNQIRQRLRDLLARPKDARGYSQEELALIKQVRDGKFGSELARYAGNLLGGGGGLGQAGTGLGAAALGAAAGGVPGAIAGAAVPVVGAASRHLYNRMVRGQVGKVDEAIRQRSPLYERLLQNAPLAATSPQARDAYLRAVLLMLGVGPERQMAVE